MQASNRRLYGTCGCTSLFSLSIEPIKGAYKVVCALSSSQSMSVNDFCFSCFPSCFEADLKR